MKYTIIIPAYNSSKFIKIPLNSLEKQTYKDKFQVLIIDDGSTDELEKTIKPYLKRNDSGELINKSNGNGGSVINLAKHRNIIMGEYVSILDSDDYFEPSALESLANFKEDILIPNIFIQNGEKKKKAKVMFGKGRVIKNSHAFTPYSMPHGKFYKKDLGDKMCDLEEGISYQDTVLFNDLLSKSNSIRFINKPLATGWYDRPGNSTTETWDLKRAMLGLETCQKIVSMPGINDEANSGALMYLWELNRKYNGEILFKVMMDTSKAKFKGLPFGIRNLTKIYMKLKTRKYRK